MPPVLLDDFPDQVFQFRLILFRQVGEGNQVFASGQQQAALAELANRRKNQKMIGPVEDSRGNLSAGKFLENRGRVFRELAATNTGHVIAAR